MRRMKKVAAATLTAMMVASLAREQQKHGQEAQREQHGIMQQQNQQMLKWK